MPGPECFVSPPDPWTLHLHVLVRGGAADRTLQEEVLVGELLHTGDDAGVWVLNGQLEEDALHRADDLLLHVPQAKALAAEGMGWVLEGVSDRN